MDNSCCVRLGKGHVNADVRRGCFEGVGGKVWLTAAAWGWARGMSMQTCAVAVSRAWGARCG
jgi:hypothetical protein